MNKYRKLVLLATFFWVTQFTVAWSQDEVFNDIRQKFAAFTDRSLQEKIYLHTDKNFYVAGDIMWFKIYCVDASFHKPVNFSKVAYVEVMDRTGKSLLQAKIALDSTGGAGSFYLPVTLASDNYTLRAYTNWMKNEGPSSFFQKIITVVNTIKPAENIERQDSIQASANFFPEGGNLVEGIETKIAFKIVDQYGKGVDASGSIIANNGDTVARFSTYKFGMGNFILNPQTDQQYKAMIVLPGGKTFVTALPVVYPYGYVMNVADNKDGRFKVKIRAKAKSQEPKGEKVFLVTHTKQALKKAEAGYVNYENELILFVDKTAIGDGISQLTLFNKEQQPVCERLIFKKPVTNNRINIKVDNGVLQQRQKAGVFISAGSGDSLRRNENYSIAVYQQDSLQQFSQDDIISYLWLSSDLKGEIESPEFYFLNEQDNEQAADNLMLTHGWRRFRWETILTATTKKSAAFIPENRGHIVAVKVTHAKDGKLAAGVPCFLSYPSTPFGFTVAKSDSSGIAFFDVKNYYGPGEIIVQAGIDTQSIYRVDVLTPFSDERLQAQPPVLTIGKNAAASLTHKSIAMQTQNIFSADSIRKFEVPSLHDTLPFFGKPEYSYRLDDYKRFTTMEEVLREYVTPINVILRNGKLYMTVYDEIAKIVYNDQLLVLIDGVPLMNFQKVFFYDPLKVKKLDVVPRKYVAGGLNFKSIASFETYQGKFDGFDLSPGLVAIDYDGLQLQREFYSPAHDKESERQKRIPDLRSTLYWSPVVPVDNSGNASLHFYTADTKGKFLVVLQGINSQGEPVSAASSFTVQ